MRHKKVLLSAHLPKVKYLPQCVVVTLKEIGGTNFKQAGKKYFCVNVKTQNLNDPKN